MTVHSSSRATAAALFALLGCVRAFSVPRACLLPHVRSAAVGRLGAQALRLCAAEDEDNADESGISDADWREMRARLVAQERSSGKGGDASAESVVDGGYVYESPLIEQGSVILGGTEQEFGFALRQQYFHKSVMCAPPPRLARMARAHPRRCTARAQPASARAPRATCPLHRLLLQHDEGFTKGIILNRPSAYEMDGWRVWFGGDVAEGAQRLPPPSPPSPCTRPPLVALWRRADASYASCRAHAPRVSQAQCFAAPRRPRASARSSACTRSKASRRRAFRCQ